MNLYWTRSNYPNGDIDLYLSDEEGTSVLAAFVRRSDDPFNPGWSAFSMLGDFPDEDVPLPTLRAAMRKARQEFAVLWIGASPEDRDLFIG
jgi:hypothetical protein